MKRFLFASAVALALAVFGGQAKSATPSNCFYANNQNASYPCPAPTPLPTGVVQGYSAWSFEDFIGVVQVTGPSNSFDRGQRGPQFAYLLAVANWAHIHHARDQIIHTTDPYLGPALLNAYASGIDFDMLYNPKEYGYGPYGNTDAGAAHYLSDLVGALPKGMVSTLEVANELDAEDGCCWLTDLPDWTQNIFYFGQQTYPNLRNIPIIFGSYAHFNRVIPGITKYMTPYVNFGNTHIYQQGFYPENIFGFGGPGYGTNDGTMLFMHINANVLTPNIPSMVTEFGVSNLTYPNSTVPQLFAAPQDVKTKYLLRSWLNMFQNPTLGIKRAFVYELESEQDNDPTYTPTDFAWGLVGDSSTYQPHPVMLGLGGLLNIIHDPHGTPTTSCQPNVGLSTPFYTPGPTPTPSATPTPAPSALVPQTVTLCKASGETDTILWLPAKSWDSVALTYGSITPSYVNIVPSPAPSSAVLWVLDPTTGIWTRSSVNLASPIPVTDTPEILALNGPSSPSPLPTYPYALVPTPFPTPTITAPPVTPTPAPTTKPTSVSVVLFTNTVSQYFPNLNTVWGTPAPQPTITQAPTNVYYGASTSTNSTSLTDAGANWTTNNYIGYTIYTGSSSAIVTSNTNHTLTVASWIGGTPASGLTYSVALVPPVPGPLHPYNYATPTVSVTPHYGDYNLTGVNVTQNSIARSVLLPAPGYTPLSSPYPQGTSSADLSVKGVIQAQAFGSYLHDQAGGPLLDPWIVGGGYYNSSSSYELRGVDSSAPIGAVAWNDGTNGYAPCGNIVAPRANSLVIALVYTGIGLSGFPWPDDQTPTSYSAGWVFDGSVVPENTAMFAFHRTALTTAGENVTGLAAAIARNPLSGQSPLYLYSPSICGMYVIQPPL